MLRCANSAFNKPRPFDETGKGQHRGARAAPDENASRFLDAGHSSRCAAWAVGFFIALGRSAPEQEQSGAESRIGKKPMGESVDSVPEKVREREVCQKTSVSVLVAQST